MCSTRGPPELWQFNFSPGVRWSYQRADDDRPFDVTPSDTIMRAAREFAERRGADISPADVIRRAIWYAACHEGLSQLVNEARFRELEKLRRTDGPSTNEARNCRDEKRWQRNGNGGTKTKKDGHNNHPRPADVYIGSRLFLRLRACPWVQIYSKASETTLRSSSTQQAGMEH